MTPQEFVQNAIRTEAPIEPAIERFQKIDESSMIELIKTFVAVSKLQDKLKKSIFYGKKFSAPEGELNKSYVDKRFIRIFHSIIGISTEAGELQEALLKIINGEKADNVNIAEEIGDTLWYIALACDELNLDPEKIMITIIEKLRARYPQRFTEQAAIVRDLDTERKILEKVVEKKD